MLKKTDFYCQKSIYFFSKKLLLLLFRKLTNEKLLSEFVDQFVDADDIQIYNKRYVNCGRQTFIFETN